MILFRIICVFQLLITVFLTCTSLVNFVQNGRFYFALESFFFMLMAALSILGLNVVSNNYPDKPITGATKSFFNWVFLLNFLLLAFLFALFFSGIKTLRLASELVNKPVLSLPVQLLVSFFIITMMLVFHFAILYGLYRLRRTIHQNFYEKTFEFENEG